jgi:membrane protease subunit HflK
MTPAVTANNLVEIGYRSSGGRNATAPRDVPEESLMVTGDENIIDIQFAVRWKVRDLVDPNNLRESGAAQFLLNVRNPEETVKVAAEAAMRELVGQSNFETIRTQDRAAVALAAQDLIQQILNDYRSGIDILEVNPQKVDPPGPVFDAFRDVQAAQADQQRLINQANAFLNEVTERAQGAAERILRDAEAYKEERIAQATGDASRFLAVYEEFRAAPEVTKRRIYLQTMEEIMQNMNKVLIETGSEGSGSGVVPYLPLNELTNRPPRPAN